MALPAPDPGMGHLPLIHPPGGVLQQLLQVGQEPHPVATLHPAANQLAAGVGLAPACGGHQHRRTEAGIEGLKHPLEGLLLIREEKTHAPLPPAGGP